MTGDQQLVAAAVIEPVRTQDDLKQFVAFPWSVYKGDPYWVPTFFRERMQFFDPKRNPFFEHSQVQLFMARRDGKVVGTVAAISNGNHVKFHDEQVGFFGHFECIDDQEVARQLLDAASEWVGAKGLKAIRGPMNMSTNDECGLLVNGFDSAPVAMMTYNPRYYERLIEANGFSKSQDLYAWIIRTDFYQNRTENLPRKVLESCEKLKAEGRIAIRQADLSRFEEELLRARHVYNAAWGRNWGFVPMTDREIEHLAHNLKKFLDEELVFFAEDDGTPVGISVGIPDVNEPLLRSYPRAGAGLLRYAYDGVRFLWEKRKRPRLLRLLIMGVIEGYRGRGIDACFYVDTARRAFEKGYELCEMSWILESNHMMNRIIQRMGGRLYKTYRVYDKAL